MVLLEKTHKLAQMSRFTTLRGMVAKNEQGGTLKASVTHDTILNVYSGSLENRNYYLMEKWFAKELSETDAKKYYLQLLASQQGGG
jgi:hypothetical protein